MTERLAEHNLSVLKGAAEIPRYDRASLKPGLVHLGVGAFHRAHQAWYTERALNNAGGGNWGVVGASLRSSNVSGILQPQDGLYTVVERAGESQSCQVIGALLHVLVGPEDPAALIDQLADPVIKVVTLTITEKGYLYDSVNDGLQWAHPDVQRDIDNFGVTPVTAVGYLAAALQKRYRSGVSGLTLLSCDNLSHNGRILQRVVCDFLARVDTDTLTWVEENVTFPCSMVDRIVPASTEKDLSALQQSLGVRDEAAVFTEPFSQWVIENNFACEVPDWVSAGAVYTDDVAPFETMKLRLLNGSHSLIAYLGCLAGYDYVHDAMADDSFCRLINAYMDKQVEPILQVPQGFNVEEYKRQLCQRFANSALNHRTRQIAQDGSQKIPQRWLVSVAALEGKGLSIDILALAVAGWVRYLEGESDNGERYTIDDPLSGSLCAALEAAEEGEAVAAVVNVFPSLQSMSELFLERVSVYYKLIVSRGIKTVIKSLE